MSLQTNVTNLATRVATEIKSVRTQFAGNNSGSLTGLTTDAKTSLVAAINELDAAIEALASAEGGATIVDGAPSGASVWSSSKTNTEIGTAISAAVTSLVDASPSTLDTLNELAAALGDDPNYATTITTALGFKAPLASPALTGTPTAPTASGGTNTTQIATTAFVQAANPDATDAVKGKVELATTSETTTGTDTTRAVTPAGVKTVADTKAALVHTHAQSDITNLTTDLAAKAPLASPALTGNPTAPTPTAGDNDTSIATTAFVTTAVASATIPDATATVKGKVELATDSEAITGTDTVRAVTPANLAAVVGDSSANFVSTFEAGLA